MQNITRMFDKDSDDDEEDSGLSWFHRMTLKMKVCENFKKIKSLLYSFHYAKACNVWRRPILRLALGQHSSEEASPHWRHCVRFDPLGNRTHDFPHQ